MSNPFAVMLSIEDAVQLEMLLRFELAAIRRNFVDEVVSVQSYKLTGEPRLAEYEVTRFQDTEALLQRLKAALP